MADGKGRDFRETQIENVDRFWYRKKKGASPIQSIADGVNNVHLAQSLIPRRGSAYLFFRSWKTEIASGLSTRFQPVFWSWQRPRFNSPLFPTRNGKRSCCLPG